MGIYSCGYFDFSWGEGVNKQRKVHNYHKLKNQHKKSVPQKNGLMLERCRVVCSLVVNAHLNSSESHFCSRGVMQVWTQSVRTVNNIRAHTHTHTHSAIK